MPGDLKHVTYVEFIQGIKRITDRRHVAEAMGEDDGVAHVWWRGGAGEYPATLQENVGTGTSE